MKKIIFGAFIVLALAVLTTSGLVMAQGVTRNPATVVPSERTVIVPDQAIDNSPVLEKAIFIHYRRGFAKPGTECGNGTCEQSENANNCPADCEGEIREGGSKCYGFLSKGAKLKSVEDLTIHPDLDDLVIRDSALEWDTHTSPTLFGSYAVDPTADWDSETPDGRNELSFGNYPQEGVIAVTVAWGYFSGPPSIREIVEFDVLFDTDYIWGNADIDPAVMDLQNIATHEIGHGVGLDDVYESSCSEATMYGYSDNGETQKRNLAPADIAGLTELYR